MIIRMGLFLALAAIVGCAQRAPTLPPVTQDEMGEIKDTEEWRDWGPEENQRRRAEAIPGRRLNTAQIEGTFSGRVLRGCYPGGEAFAERLAADGKFYDVLLQDKYLGTWAAQNAQLCFRYPERAQAGQPDTCLVVVKNNNAFDFYTADLANKAASTACQNRP